jgi:hypothetical protein
MQVNVQEFLAEAGITEEFYPGKRLVHSCKQTGQYKSHCVVFDWRDPDKIRVEVKAGLSGRNLEVKDLKHYPVCFQAPTYVDIDVINDNDTEHDDEDETQGSGSGSGGGKQPKKRGLNDLKSLAFSAFGDVIEGKVPEIGRIVEMMVMGKEIAAQAYGQVMEKLAQQISHAKIAATDLLAQAGKFVTKYTPPSFMQPKGNEDVKYKYDRTKNENIAYMKAANVPKQNM